MLQTSIFTTEAVPFVFFFLFFDAAVVFSYTLCMHSFILFVFFQHFVSFRWLSILFITRFTTLQGVVYVGALLVIFGPIIRFFKRPLFFSFSLFFVISQPVIFLEKLTKCPSCKCYCPS